MSRRRGAPVRAATLLRVSTRVDKIELDHPADQILIACRQALVELGWTSEVSEDELLVLAREDETKLCCRQSPIAVEIKLQERTETTTVGVRGSVPGFGPVSSQALRSRLEGLWRHLFAALGQ